MNMAGRRNWRPILIGGAAVLVASLGAALLHWMAGDAVGPVTLSAIAAAVTAASVGSVSQKACTELRGTGAICSSGCRGSSASSWMPVICRYR